MIAQQKTDQKKSVSGYQDNQEYLDDELTKLDLLIELKVLELRQQNLILKEAALCSKMYISHEEVDWLLSHNGTFSADHPKSQNTRRKLEVLQNAINIRVKKSIEDKVFLSLLCLADIFALSPIEMQTVLICLAPEIDRKYDKLYAYLQDDITRKKPSIDLVLDLLCPTKEARRKALSIFSDNAPLFRFEIVHTIEDFKSPSGSSALAKFIKLDQRIINYLLDNNSIDGRLQDIVRFFSPPSSIDLVPVDRAIKTKALELTLYHLEEQRNAGKRLALYFHGKYGAGKRSLALGICGKVRCPMLCLDMEELMNHEQDAETLLKLMFREGLLFQAAIYLENTDILFEEDKRSKVFMKRLARMISEYGWLTFLSGQRNWISREIREHTAFHSIELPVPDESLRKQVWDEFLKNTGAETRWSRQLASRFSLTPGQIRDAVEFLNFQDNISRNPSEISLHELYAACRNQSNQKLSELSLKVDPHYSWEDIILPEGKLDQLREICIQVKHRSRVFSEWGFEKKLSYGKGLSVLFAGPPGTGKTMAAEVIAHELQLDLYKVDLSGVVSKYIGETEKNLSKIFQEAETSNAILFFDEADALFGKRTKVSDAHDRFANIETSYLLQKMEEYEGIVILASNFRENMDEAFIRRIRFIVEFPFPDEASRLLIWKTHFPAEAPVSGEIDYGYLSRQFQIAGGNIRNIVLNSAFIAVENGQVIDMEHILKCVKREFEKIGKLWNESRIPAFDQKKRSNYDISNRGVRIEI